MAEGLSSRENPSRKDLLLRVRVKMAWPRLTGAVPPRAWGGIVRGAEAGGMAARLQVHVYQNGSLAGVIGF